MATLVTKNSSTASAVPGTGDLVQGELAVNVTDKRLFTKNAGGTVVEVGTNPSSLVVDGNVGVGVTPSAWLGAGYIDFPGNGYVGNATGYSSNTLSTGLNAYYATGAWRYKASSLAATRFDHSNGTFQWFTAPSGTAGNAISFTQAMTLTSGGDLLVGATTALGRKIVVGGDSTTGKVVPAVDNVGYVGDISYRWQAIYAVNGTIQTSDGRQKNTIEDSNLGLGFINALRPVSYKWNVGENLVTYDAEGKEVVTPRPGVRTHYGFIAQEVKAAIPNGVDFGGFVEEPNDGPMSLRYHEFIGPMVKAIQELKAQNDELRARVAALESV